MSKKLYIFLTLFLIISPKENESIDCTSYANKLNEIFDDPILNSKKITIKSTNSSVQDLIQMVGMAIGIDFVIDIGVEGQIGRVFFKDTNASTVLKFICQNNDLSLSIIKENDVFWVVTKERAFERCQQHTVHKVFDLHYINPTDKFKEIIEKTWDNILDPKEKTNSYISIDAERKKILCKATVFTMNQFKGFLSQIDRPMTKVKIDAIIVFAEKNWNFDFGINWSGIYNRLDTIKLCRKAFDFVGLGGTLTDYPTPTSHVPGNKNLHVNPDDFAVNVFTKHSRCFRSRHGDGSILKLPFVFGGPDLNVRRLNLVLNAAEIESKAKIISRPSVVTNDNEVAKILIGESLPIQTGRINEVALTTNGSVDFPTVVYKDIGISLEVHPIVSPDKKKIKLEIFLEESEVVKGTTVTNEKGVMQDPPVIDMIKIHNKVTLEDGQTAIIGGLSTYDERKQVNSVPFLYKIPIIGKLFSAIYECKREFEQFIFITPTVMMEGVEYDECEKKLIPSTQ